MVNYFEKEQGHFGGLEMARIDCGCNHCRPLIIEYNKQKRKETQKLREERFKFVKEIVKNNIVIDDNTPQNTSFYWHKFQPNAEDWILNSNVVELPPLLKRMNRLIPFNLNRMKPETQATARRIFAEVFKDCEWLNTK